MIYKYIVIPSALALLSFTGAAQIRYSKADTLRDSRGNVAGISSFEFQMSEGVSYQDRVEYIETQKRTFFSYYIGFTSQEAELFWPIYNEYMKKLGELFEKRRKLQVLLTSNQIMNLDEKTVKKNLEDFLNCENAQSTMKMEYYKKFSQILSPLKMVRYYIAEDEFQKRLLRALKGGGW